MVRLSLFAAVLCIGLPTAAASAREVRVAVPLAATVEASAALRWRDATGKKGRDARFEQAAHKAPIDLSGRGSAVSGGRRFPLPARIIEHGGRRYAVIELELERYLMGVLPVEMHPDWPTEALKAQAVLARTYAARRLTAGGRDAFDLIAGTIDQEFRWDESPPVRVEAAVRATRGETLTERSGGLAEVTYHSCCGGHTADATEVWGRASPAIVSVDDELCSICPNYFWTLRLDPVELGGAVGLGPVEEVRIEDRGPSGRVRRLVLTDGARSVTMTGMGFRTALGAARLPSTHLQVRAVDDRAGPHWLLQGSGSGHGAGLCQWGARARAEAGQNYRDILSAYFPRLVSGRLR